MIDTFASTSTEDRQLLTEVLAIIFRYSGEKIDRVPQNDAVPATGVSTWTRTSADELAVGARLVPAGTELTLTGLDGELVAFATTADFTFADGSLTTGAGAVGVIAVLPGVAGNGLQAGAAAAQTIPWLNAIAVTAPTAGGVDAEDDDAYLDRLADTRPLRARTLIMPDDFARFARNESGVARALSIDNFNGTTTTAGHVTVIPTDGAGAALSGPAMTALNALMQAITATNLIVHTIAPAYTTIAVVYAGKARAGWDATDVKTRSEAAVLEFLDRARWGTAAGETQLWTETLTVRFQDVSAVLNGVEGFDYWTSLTVNGGTSDVVMTGPGALPGSASTAAGTVSL